MNYSGLDNVSYLCQHTFKHTEKERKKKTLLQLIIEYVMPSDYPTKTIRKLMKSLLSGSLDEENQIELKLKKDLKLILPILLASKYNRNFVGPNGQTVLYCFLMHYANEMQSCSKDRSLKDNEIVEILLIQGSSIVIFDRNGDTPLGIAIMKRRIDLVRTMLKHSPNVEVYNKMGQNFLHIIIDNYANCNDHWEHYFDYIEIIRDLVNKGADPNKNNYIGMTPVHIAVKHCFLEILLLFVESKANFEAVTNNGDNLLMVVCSEITRVKDTQALLKTINFLLGRGFNASYKNYFDCNCLHYASQSKQLTVLERLLKAGADPNVVAADDSTPLHSAAMLGSIETVQYLLNCGVNPHKRENKFRFTLLHAAALNYDEKILLLIARQQNIFNVNVLSENNLTPLHLASMSGNIKVVKVLIKLGADVNCQVKVGQYTPLHLSSMRGRLSDMKRGLFAWKSCSLISQCLQLVKFQAESSCQVIDALVKAGADVNAKDAFGWTPLHLAASQSNSDVVEILLKHGAFVDVQDEKGLLPLHKILNSGNFKGLDSILASGADVNDIEVPRNSFTEMMNNCKSQIANHLLKHIVKLQAANVSISDVYTTYLHEFQASDYHFECLSEVAKLKNCNIKKTLSLYDLLQTNFKRKFTNIGTLPPNLKTEFPIYCTAIEGSYRVLDARKSMLELAQSAFDQLTMVCWPELCSEYIFHYLSNKDLRAVIDSVSNEYSRTSIIRTSRDRAQCLNYRRFRIDEFLLHASVYDRDGRMSSN